MLHHTTVNIPFLLDLPRAIFRYSPTTPSPHPSCLKSFPRLLVTSGGVCCHPCLEKKKSDPVICKHITQTKFSIPAQFRQPPYKLDGAFETRKITSYFCDASTPPDKLCFSHEWLVLLWANEAANHKRGKISQHRLYKFGRRGSVVGGNILFSDTTVPPHVTTAILYIEPFILMERCQESFGCVPRRVKIAGERGFLRD